jgi:hypothetical protein
MMGDRLGSHCDQLGIIGDVGEVEGIHTCMRGIPTYPL